MLQKIRETVLQKTVDGMRKEGVPYLGMYKILAFLIMRRTAFYFRVHGNEQKSFHEHGIIPQVRRNRKEDVQK